MEGTPNNKSAVRFRLLVLSFGLVLAIGLVLIYWQTNTLKVAGKPLAIGMAGQAHAAQKRKQEIDRRFAQGVAMLNAKQFDAAAGELHRVIELAPKMPEAHVNLGFAMVGAQRYALARDSFTRAIDLNTHQLNAYYGLAVALEGLRDVPGALGAMRSYVHLSKADDPFLTKANAAIWEWESDLKTADSDKVGVGVAPGSKRGAKP